MKTTLLLILLLTSTLINAQTVLINEVDADTPSTDTKEFIELKTSTPNMSLDGYVVVLFNGSDDKSYASFDLDGYTSDVNGLFTLGTEAVSPSPNYIFPKASNNVQNGPDAVAVYKGNATDFGNDTPITTTNLEDILIYDTNDSDDTGLLNGFGITIQYNEDANGDKDNHSNQRKPDNTFEAKTPTPGALNDGGGIQLPRVTISCAKSKYTEGESINLIFSVSENVSSDLILNYTLVNENFEANDYSGSLSIKISAGSSTSQTAISLTDDQNNEGNEWMVVQIIELDPAYIADNNNYKIEIVDNDYSTSTWGTPLAPTYDKVISTAPSDYYASLEGLSGEELRNAIVAIISNPSIVRAQTYGDVWDILKEADQNPANNNEVWLLYTEQGRAKTEQQGSGSSVGKWNREHIYPQSRGGFSDGTSTSADGKDVYMTTDASHIEHAHSDAHGLRPADSSENSSRSNKDYGEDYNGPTGNSGSWKGDVARSAMYMSLRYNSLDVVNGNPDNSTVGELGDLSYLIAWHEEDKPDDYEMNRNNVIYDWQKNRNPFIDLPGLVDYVFGDKTSSTWDSSTGIDNIDGTLLIYPNPVIDEIVLGENITGSFSIYDLTGNLIFKENLNTNRIDISNLQSGVYFYVIRSNNNFYKGKFIKN